MEKRNGSVLIPTPNSLQESSRSMSTIVTPQFFPRSIQVRAFMKSQVLPKVGRKNAKNLIKNRTKTSLLMLSITSYLISQNFLLSLLTRWPARVPLVTVHSRHRPRPQSDSQRVKLLDAKYLWMFLTLLLLFQHTLTVSKKNHLTFGIIFNFFMWH